MNMPEPIIRFMKRSAINMEIENVVAAAAKVDVIVACSGENSYCETPGN